MAEKNYQPISITPNFYQIGTREFPAYLSMGEEGMIIEGGTGPTTKIMIQQIEELEIDQKRIKYIALTHTHPDHIGALPYLKHLWPHAKVVASPVAAEALCKEEMLKPFLYVDRSIGEIMKAKGEIEELPPAPEEYNFEVDWAVEEGDKIDLGSGIVWTVYHTPGHSSCHMSLFEEKESTLIIGDATGFYSPEKDVFWPNYFQSLEKYCNTIRKLATLPAQRGALSHNCVIEGNVRHHFEKALMATERYHTEIMERIGAGEDVKEIAKEKAEWVDSLTDIQPFEMMLNLSKLLIKCSQRDADKPNLFAPIQGT
jgi:glyoxylase-like metal-dependent hydrolase (beta-lactamase superfamily II)